MVVPFAPAVTHDERSFNKYMSTLRVSVEHNFGHITKLWSYTDLKRVHRTGEQPTAAHYHCMALFTNLHTCMHGSQTSDFFDLQPPSITEYLGQT